MFSSNVVVSVDVIVRKTEDWAGETAAFIGTWAVDITVSTSQSKEAPCTARRSCLPLEAKSLDCGEAERGKSRLSFSEQGHSRRGRKPYSGAGNRMATVD